MNKTITNRYLLTVIFLTILIVNKNENNYTTLDYGILILIFLNACIYTIRMFLEK